MRSERRLYDTRLNKLPDPTNETAFFVKNRLDSKLAQYGQTHLLKFWDELNPDCNNRKLADQIDAIDFELVQSLFTDKSAAASSDDTAMRAEVPPAITLDDFADKYLLRIRGCCRSRSAMASGELAMILVAGGQGSRLGFNHPKGMYKIGPVSNVSLYQIHFEKVMARAKQFGAPVPMYVMTSPPTHEETSAFLREHNFFGMNPDHVRIFCQGVMPAVDDDGKLLLAAKDEVFVSP